MSGSEDSLANQLQLTTMTTDYNQRSRNQSRCLQQFKPLLDTAVAALSSDLSEAAGPFVIADFGCSTGLNSSDAVCHVIGELLKKFAWESCGSVLVVLNDLPRNPWGELFAFLHGDERSFLEQHQGVSAVASGLSFYQQVLPSNSLKFGMSSMCLHWCSQIPVKMSDHCFAILATDTERLLFRQQAAKDWNDFMAARSKELVRGGVLAVNLLTTQEETIAIFEAIYQSAKGLLTRGVIEPEELLDFNYRMCFRSVEEVSDKSQYESLGLELLRAEKFPLTRSVYYDDFLQHGDANRFVLEYSGSCRATCNSTLLSALSVGRSEAAKAAISEEMWREHRAIVSERPGDFRFTWSTIAVVVRKT